jgi:hypothetical protein
VREKRFLTSAEDGASVTTNFEEEKKNFFSLYWKLPDLRLIFAETPKGKNQHTNKGE